MAGESLPVACRCAARAFVSERAGVVDKSVEWKTVRRVAVGSRIAFVAQFLGRRIAYTYEIVELFPGERLVMRTADGPFPMETTYTWQTVAAGRTRMTLRNRGVPSGFSAWVAPFMAFAMRRANRKDLALLKRVLESSRASDSSKNCWTGVGSAGTIRKGLDDGEAVGGDCMACSATADFIGPVQQSMRLSRRRSPSPPTSTAERPGT